MTSDLEKIEHTVAMSLQDSNDVTRDLIKERVSNISIAMGISLLPSEVSSLVKKLEASFQVTMSLGSTLIDSDHQPWLSNQREHINWYYWNRYKQLLVKNGFGNKVLGSMDIITDEVLDLLQNPKDNGAWQRKGLVVGHVQSGKTANYAGLICKALDSGYRVIIVLAGLLNSLRKQTQERIDSGVIGIDSALILENIPLREKLIGVGRFNNQGYPVSITTAHADFNKPNATQRQEAINQYNQPLVFVIKKNVSILRNLIDWLKNNNFDLDAYPMLLIDDEADHASINTRKSDLDPTTTNARIRELLELFPKNVYLGYTATPFANIFINPDSVDDMMNDLFPENFIKTLDAPSNYFGGLRVFVSKELDAIRVIDDYDDFLPLKHKIEEIPEFLSDSLMEAVRAFILIRAVRILRGQESEHNSMLVNVSRFTGIQSALRILIHNYISRLRDAIFSYHALDEENAFKNLDFQALNNTWEKEFQTEEFQWASIQSVLKKAIGPIDVIEVNGSRNAEKEIDYSIRNYPEGRHVITVGGLSLSRGITLEGLTTTYFLRNSIMYDTLMQMGRWFGYRPGYEDLCRIYMTEQAQAWYEHISLATEELRGEFKRMDDLKKTPKDFGLCVRSHPDSLIVTARNKMRSARPVFRDIDLTGRLIETTRLFLDQKMVSRNLQAMATLFEKVKRTGEHAGLAGVGKLLWKKVPYEDVSDFIEMFQNHPESIRTDSDAVKKYINNLASDDDIKIKYWNVLFVSVQKPSPDLNIKPIPELCEIGPGLRRQTTLCPTGIMLGQRKVASEGIEKTDLTTGSVREIPLLMLHLLDCRLKNKDDGNPLFPNGVAAYGISFPGVKNGRRIKKMATYQVNKVWWKEKYGYDFEDDADMRGEYE